ncbi:hypothetical protein [Absidia glauca]|uniref:Uncharacterized protein n=1 Tax=Absidia glauca TaxID=4829 RepID=A0A168MYN2_ABSGL|nr:hypothetical protein [Absidia glauca]
MTPPQQKSCLRKRTNYCRVQFIEETDDMNDGFLATPPDSPVESHLEKGSLPQDQMIMMYEHLYKKEKERAQLLESQIQHLQVQLMDRDQKLDMKDDDGYKYGKVSHLVNHIISLSQPNDTAGSKMDQHSASLPKKECTSSLESIHDHLQQVLFDLMVTQQQQTRHRYDPSDDLYDSTDYYHHPTNIYY